MEKKAQRLLPWLRRFLAMCLGIVIMGLGIALFRIALMGNDPATSLAMAVADQIGMNFAYVQIVLNSLYFIAEFIWGRKLVGG